MGLARMLTLLALLPSLHGAEFMRGAAMGMLPVLDCNGTCSRYRANATAGPQDALDGAFAER